MTERERLASHGSRCIFASLQEISVPLIRDLPPDERPRQRLLRSGPHSLSDPELLSILLGNGCREVCSLALAWEILDEGDGLLGLVGIDAERLQRRGLGEAKAAAVLASLELARRLAHAEMPKRAPMNNALAVVRYLIPSTRSGTRRCWAPCSLTYANG